MFNKLIHSLFALLLFFTAQLVIAQDIARPRALAIKGTYTHSQTKTAFPTSLAGHERVKIYYFDSKRSNIGATYQSKNTKTIVSVYLYPAGDASEDRLRLAYLAVLDEIAMGSKKGITSIPGLTYYNRDGYKLNGIRAEMTDVKTNLKSYVSIFECGKWFFKIRTTSALLESTEVSNLERQILSEFNPIDLVKQNPLNSKSTVHFAPAAFADSLMLVSAMGAALKKLEWISQNVDSLELAAGFPSLYLELHVEALKEFVNKSMVVPASKRNWAGLPSTLEYLYDLNEIIKSGFLREFIMEQNDMIMIVPENAKLDFEAYRQWRLVHPVKINLQERFYLIVYKEK